MRPARRRITARRPRCKIALIDLALAAAALGGLFAAARPLLDDAGSSQMARQVISTMTASTDETFDESRMQVLADAQHYNATLTSQAFALSNRGNGGSNGGGDDILDLYDTSDETDSDTPEKPRAYERQLQQEDSTAMCWLEIPSIAVREPVYHGTSDEALAMGVGHLEWSSLPVGGTPSHCVLAAHSGMPEARMFDDLDKLRPGDVFVLHVLGDSYQYEVYQTEVLIPRKAREACPIVEGKDLCTLMTCTPYGVNTHRLLVHATRVPFEPHASTGTVPVIPIGRTIHARRLTPMLLAVVGLAMPQLLWHLAQTLVRATAHIMPTVRPGRR